MSDREIREAERLVEADPSDAVALEKLAAARTRAGSGWADETLPRDLVCSTRERGVYVWTRHGLGLEMVRVPACPFSDMPPSWVHAFWIGRFPVTAYEEAAWPESRSGNLGVVGRREHPAVNVTHADAVAFCAWAGLRLPTSAEWTRAALGDATEPCPAGPVCVGAGQSLDCLECRGKGTVPRRYPWGNEPPTPERCVAGGVLYASTDPNRRTTLPVRDPEGHPARPDGASPCGAQDMAGHVWERTAGAGEWGGLRGGSFLRGPLTGVSDAGSTNGSGGADIGFRVALSESTA